MLKQEQIVREILDSWALGPEETVQAWRDHCTDDLVWWNSVRGTITGLNAACKKLDEMQQSLLFQTSKASVRNIAATEKRVMVERFEELYRADGSLLVTIPVVGIIEFEGEKIKEWRDYCADWMAKISPAKQDK